MATKHKIYLKVKGRIVELGYTQNEVASRLGMAGATLSHKLNGGADFWLSEIVEMANLLDIPPEKYHEYFF